MLCANEYAFLSGTKDINHVLIGLPGWNNGVPSLGLLVNDVFAWGCADCESIDYMDAPALVKIIEKDGYTGLIKWVIERRTGEPLTSNTPDEVWSNGHLLKYTPDLPLLVERDQLKLENQELKKQIAILKGE